ncbi:MAG: carboxypeptidase-like regulatory domain-containing protein [Planctomycetota bacterium]|nr:carboxypeptidase-like regulatory domain-containing protein [Planctomycetota bacterium]MDA1180173.1 carboxypeptidase-like regulatory domain-containing protein [Planctomycetota bacterium]
MEPHRKGTPLVAARRVFHTVEPKVQLARVVFGIATAASLLAVLSLTGCNNGQKVFPLKVRVTNASGQPLSGVSVVFNCAEAQKSANGSTDADGACSLSTFKPGDGVVLGKHSVSVFIPNSWEDKPDPKKKVATSAIPARYADPSTSGLEYTIAKDGPREVEIVIQAK